MTAERKRWLDDFIARLDALFGARLEFFGLQGSYGRGEQTTGSDIDLVIVLDRVDFADLTAYRKLLDGTEDGALVCGFVTGADELSAWDAADFVQLYLDTVPVGNPGGTLLSARFSASSRVVAARRRCTTTSRYITKICSKSAALKAHGILRSKITRTDGRNGAKLCWAAL